MRAASSHGEQQHEGHRAEQHRRPHDRAARRVAERAHDARLGMDGPPPVHRLVDKRRRRRAEDPHRGGELLRSRAAVLANQQVAEKDQLDDQRHHDAGVAGEPGAPRLAAPQGAAEETEADEDHDQFGGGNADAIGARRADEQVDGARDPADRQRGRARHPRGEVIVENLLHEQHRRLVRRLIDEHRRVREHRGGDHDQRKK